MLLYYPYHTFEHVLNCRVRRRLTQARRDQIIDLSRSERLAHY